MIGLFCFVLVGLASPLKSKARLEAENAVLRHQLIVLRRRARDRGRLLNHNRLFFIKLYRWFPSILQVLTIIRPENRLWGTPRIHGERSSWGLRSRSRASPSIWSNGGCHPVRDGAPF